MIDLGLLAISGVIFHHVPQRPWNATEAAKVAPVLSGREHVISDALELYLRDQVSATFLRSAQNVLPDPDEDATVPDALLTFLTDEMTKSPVDADAFVELSQTLAELLYDRQHPNAPAGLVVIFRGTVGPTPLIGVAKLEQQSGLSFDFVENDGVQTVEVYLEDGLVLTEDTEVFKAAVFVDGSDTGDPSSLEGLVSDEQSGKVYNAPVTSYWLRAFLGCRYANESDVQTRAFIKAISTAINKDIDDLVDRNKAHDALMTELESNSGQIKPKDWIKKHVPESDQDKVLQRLRDEGAPVTTFPKSREVADHAPKNTWYEFADGTRVKVPLDGAEAPDLQSEGSEGTRTDILTVRGRIVRIR